MRAALAEAEFDCVEKRDPHLDDSSAMPTTQRPPAVDKRARSEKRAVATCAESGSLNLRTPAARGRHGASAGEADAPRKPCLPSPIVR